MTTIKQFSHFIADSTSTVMDYANVFYRYNILNNGKCEDLCNYLLAPARIAPSLIGKKVTSLDLTQGVYNLEDDFCFFGAVTCVYPVLWPLAIAAIIMGTVLKLATWLFVPGVLKKNADFIQLRAQERVQPLNYWNNSNLHKQIESHTSASDYFVAKDVLDKIAEYLIFAYLKAEKDKDKDKALKDLFSFSHTSRACYVVSHDLKAKALIQENQKIEQTFSSLITYLNLPDLASRPKIRLRAHRTSTTPTDYKIQKYGSTEIIDKWGIFAQDIELISSKEMGSHSIKYGMKPTLFIAFQVNFVVKDTTYLSKIAYHVGLKKTLFLNKTGVITVYRDSGQYWSIHLPWAPKTNNSHLDNIHFATLKCLPTRDFHAQNFVSLRALLSKNNKNIPSDHLLPDWKDKQVKLL